MAQRGARVIATDLADTVVKEITDAGGQATAIIGDVSDQASVDKSVEQAVGVGEQLGLVN